MSLSKLLGVVDAVQGHGSIGSILHGAYGDYYEQMVCLRYLKSVRPDLRIVIFYATESRRQELSVFDQSFAAGVHPAAAITSVAVDRFVQFQIRDRELGQDILQHLPAAVRQKFDWGCNLKPWSVLRTVYRESRPTCDLPLSLEGLARLPACLAQNEIDPSMFEREFTVGFLWRHRKPGEAVWSPWQTDEEVVHRTKSELFAQLISQYNAKVVVAGMAVGTTDENRVRTDSKYSDRRLSTPSDSTFYLKGLSWGLELEIMRRCSLCIVMPSGFSEALLMKRDGRIALVDPPPYYIAILLKNRMPFFGVRSPRQLAFLLRQPHTAERVMKYLRSNRLLPVSKRVAGEGTGNL